MTRLKPSSKNLVKTALLSFSFIFCIILSGCQNPAITPSFKEENIPDIIKQMCKDEYGLDVATERRDNTLWIYAPFTKILDKEYGIKEGKVLDEQMTDKLRNILTALGRVILSADNAPDFFALWSSDINMGMDYIIIGNILDLKKAYAESIPFDELNKRYLMKFEMNPAAINDKTGQHAQFYSIKMQDFLAQQMVQRIAMQFQKDKLKKYFKLDKIDGIFANDTFILEYAVTELLKPEKSADALNEILNAVAQCIKNYDFQDFSRVEITNLVTRKKTTLSKVEIFTRPSSND